MDRVDVIDGRADCAQPAVLNYRPNRRITVLLVRHFATLGAAAQFCIYFRFSTFAA
jgi:hypothetical protein